MKPDQWLALASWVGAHGLAVFVVLLAALLLLVAFIAWVWDGQVLRRTHAAFSRPAVLLLKVAAGFAIVLGAAAGFAEIA